MLMLWFHLISQQTQHNVKSSSVVSNHILRPGLAWVSSCLVLTLVWCRRYLHEHRVREREGPTQKRRSRGNKVATMGD